jgi:hypothetical protein
MSHSGHLRENETNPLRAQPVIQDVWIGLPQ